jgi:hypothetical protein
LAGTAAAVELKLDRYREGINGRVPRGVGQVE